MTEEAIGASFRDPSGHVYRRDGVIYRDINRSYAPHYDQLMSSGLYEKLVSRRLLIAHEEISDRRSADETPLPDHSPGEGRLHLSSVRVVIQPAEGRRPRDAARPA